jgi:YVTN family beta-propeller protein
MKHCLLDISLFASLLLAYSVSGDRHSDNLLFVANQMEHTVLLVDPMSKHVVARVGVDITGHEVAVSPDGHFGYVPVRPHCAHFGPDGLLYVSAELANAIYIVDTKTRSLAGEIPTGASHTHMLVISPDGRRIYTANNEAGSVSVLDLQARTLVTTIPISKKVQRISISPDGKFVFTQDQETPRVVVIDTATNAVVRSIPLP